MKKEIDRCNMKTNIIYLFFATILLLGCKEDSKKYESKPFIDSSTPVTSIDAKRNGTPFINYLGSKIDGC